MRLIDADNIRVPNDERYKGTLRRLIMQQPTIEAEPVRYGRWELRGQDIYCSECGSESGYNAWGASAFSVRCPNCGAKMDKGMKND